MPAVVPDPEALHAKTGWLAATSMVMTHSGEASRPVTVRTSSLDPSVINVRGVVTRGYGRGSKELGIPTANLPTEVAADLGNHIKTGIHYGFAKVPNLPGAVIYPMVMSFGWNPFYRNTVRSAEVYVIDSVDNVPATCPDRLRAEVAVLQRLPSDFYGQEMRVAIVGWIREEKDYNGVEQLISDIRHDVEDALEKLSDRHELKHEL